MLLRSVSFGLTSASACTTLGGLIGAGVVCGVSVVVKSITSAGLPFKIEFAGEVLDSVAAAVDFFMFEAEVFPPFFAVSDSMSLTLPSAAPLDFFTLDAEALGVAFGFVGVGFLGVAAFRGEGVTATFLPAALSDFFTAEAEAFGAALARAFIGVAGFVEVALLAVATFFGVGAGVGKGFLRGVLPSFLRPASCLATPSANNWASSRSRSSPV